MDLLVKPEAVPLSLRKQALGRAAGLMGAVAVSEDAKKINFRCLASQLPVCLREELLPLALAAIKCSPLIRWGEKQLEGTEQNPSAASAMLRLIEWLSVSELGRFNLDEEFSWDGESRRTMLRLLNHGDMKFKSMAFNCYEGKKENSIFHQSSLVSSESSLLRRAIKRMEHLRTLTLHAVCNNDILIQVGVTAKHLQTLDIRDGVEVDDRGIRLFLEKSTKIFLLVVNLEGTSISQMSGTSLLNVCKNLRELRLNQDIWHELLKSRRLLHQRLAACNVAVDKHSLDPLLGAFPNVRTLNINGCGFSFQPKLVRHYFDRVGLRDTKVNESVATLLENVTFLRVSGSAASIDVAALSRYCTQLERLSVSDAELLQPDSRELSHARTLCNLRHLSLCDIGGHSAAWKFLIKLAPALETLNLYNLTVTDSDMVPLLSQGNLTRLTEARISSCEIGYIRLTELSVWAFVKNCPCLMKLGSVCDWMVKDLLGLLNKLVYAERWKLVLCREEDHPLLK